MEFGSHKGSEFLGEKIIFLDELLQIVKDNKLFVNLELKNNYVFYYGLEEAVIKMVKEFGLKDDVILSSFNQWNFANKLILLLRQDFSLKVQ